MKKSLILASVLLLIGHQALAVCPLCTLAVGAGLGISRWLGIDDLITSIWIGGLLTSLSLWLKVWLDKKNIRIKTILCFIASYGLTFVPLYFAGIVGHPDNVFWGIDRVLFGTVIGTIGFFLSLFVDKKIRNKEGKALFPYQRVVLPVAILFVLSLIFYLIIR